VEENFEGEFPGTWLLVDDDGAGEYYWGKRSCRRYGGFYAGWAVGGGADGALLACGSHYPDNAGSWMIYGPFSLADATAADLSLRLWVDSADGYDQLAWMASTDGTFFNGYVAWGSWGGWAAGVLDLSDVPHMGDLMGQPNVWIALRFESDAYGNSAEGAYVDDIVLRKFVSGSAGTGAPSTSLQSAAKQGALLKVPVQRMLRQLP